MTLLRVKLPYKQFILYSLDTFHIISSKADFNLVGMFHIETALHQLFLLEFCIEIVLPLLLVTHSI